MYAQESITNNTFEISKDDRERVRGVLQQYRENIAYHYQKWGDKNEPNYNGDFIDQIEKGLENNVSYEVDLGGLPAGGHFMLFYSIADAAARGISNDVSSDVKNYYLLSFPKRG